MALGSVMSYLITIHLKNAFHELFLPGIDNRVWYYDVDEGFLNFKERVSIRFEIWNGKWLITESENLTITKQNRKIVLEELSAGDIYVCKHKSEAETFALMVEDLKSGYTSFARYLLSGPVTIGRNDDNTIQYENRKLVSARHAQIAPGGRGKATVTDFESQNGTYVNGRRIVKPTAIDYGDVVFVLGLKVVFLGDVIAVNQPAEPVVVRGLDRPAEQEAVPTSAEPLEDEYYIRSPRRLEPLDTEPVEIENPPPPPNQQRQPLFFTIGPAITMMIPMASGVIFNVVAQSNSGSNLGPFIFVGLITSATAAAIGIFWALANHRYNKRMEAAAEQLRLDRYGKYLARTREGILRKNESNRDRLTRMYPSTVESLAWPRARVRRVWERNVNHADFLTVRLGVGRMPSPTGVTIPKERFTLLDDRLGEEPKRIQTECGLISGVPVCFSLDANRLVGVIGERRQDILDTARLIAAQLAVYHSYTDVKMLFVYPKDESARWDWARWLPHVWVQDYKLRLLASDPMSAGDVLYHVSGVLRERAEADQNRQAQRALPHYVCFIADPAMAESDGAIKPLLSPQPGMGVTTVLLFDKIDRLPNNCTAVIQRDGEYNGYYSLDNSFPGCDQLSWDLVAPEAMDRFAREISNIKVRETGSAGAPPSVLSFLDMYRTSRLEDLDVGKRWLENRTYESMKAMVGYKSEESPVYLDIHEKHHGPHGLVAGTTGSGKSETLQTYILSLALNYHPHEVSFILIDYKGGGMAGSFEKLPHVAGIITNLGGNQTNRALTSIHSEIKRRQAIFNDYKIKHIDEYIELFRAGTAMMPLPHLLIIVDEFAELKKEQGDFVRELVSASRVGRSLGVHLILATQKPDGVVDDEIWGNSKFRICLRVQDKQDSMGMLKRTEAAYITNVGRGYFQVGNDEIFTEFQSGWSGAKYEPAEAYAGSRRDEPQMINQWGKRCVLKRRKKGRDQGGAEKKKTQLEAAVEFAAALARQMEIKPVDNIWLPPLPAVIRLGDIPQYAEYKFRDGAWPAMDSCPGIRAIVGMADDPVRQCQSAYAVDLAANGHLLIVGPGGSGKTVLLQTLLYSLCTTYSPERLSVYIADFGSRTMSVFSALPHVGGVVDDTDGDSVTKLVQLMFRELARRKELFAGRGFGTYNDYARVHSDTPAVVLAVDNFAGFMERFPLYEDSFIQLAREAASYGIYLVLTCSGVNDVRGRIRQSINYAIGLQLMDKYSYRDVLGQPCDIVAEAKTPGRAVVCNPYAMEMQAALCCAAAESSVTDALKAEFTAIAGRWQGGRAPVIPRVPRELTCDAYRELPELRTLTASDIEMPVGYEMQDAEPLALRLPRCFCFAIGGGKRSGKTNLIKFLLWQAAQKSHRAYVFDNPTRELEEYAKSLGAEYMSGSKDLFEFLRDTLMPEVTQRNRKISAVGDRSMSETALVEDRRIHIFINGMGAFCDAVYGSEQKMSDFLEMVMEKGSQHRITFYASISREDYTANSSRTIMKNFLLWQDGIHLGGASDQQRIFEFELSGTERSKKLPAGMGHMIVGGRTLLVKTPLV